MSKTEKLIKRLLSKPKDFKYSELKALLLYFGYEEIQGAGSRVCFSSEKHKIKLHKPHSGNELKLYQIDFIIEVLITRELIKNELK